MVPQLLWQGRKSWRVTYQFLDASTQTWYRSLLVLQLYPRFYLVARRLGNWRVHDIQWAVNIFTTIWPSCVFILQRTATSSLWRHPKSWSHCAEFKVQYLWVIQNYQPWNLLSPKNCPLCRQQVSFILVPAWGVMETKQLFSFLKSPKFSLDHVHFVGLIYLVKTFRFPVDLLPHI